MKKKMLLFSIIITLLSMIGYKWYHYNKKYTEIEIHRSMCDNPKNCIKCIYYKDCYSFTNENDI